jgi:hypothetical protein
MNQRLFGKAMGNHYTCPTCQQYYDWCNCTDYDEDDTNRTPEEWDEWVKEQFRLAKERKQKKVEST